MGNMTMEEVVGQVKAHVSDLVKTAGLVSKSDVEGLKPTLMTKAEYDERFKKIEEGMAKALKALEDETVRRTNAPTSGPVDEAAKHLVGSGYNAFRPKANEGPNSKTKALSGVSVLDTDPVTRQTRDSFTMPDSVRAALRIMDEVYIVDRLMSFSKAHGPAWAQLKAEKGERAAFLEKFSGLGGQHDAFVKAFMAAQGKSLTTTGAGTGLEWVPSAFATSVLDQIRLQMPLVNLIPHVNMPANPWTYPLLTGIGRAYRKTELSAVTQSDLATKNRTWAAHVHAVYEAFSDEVDEDSIVAIAPEVRANIIRASGEGMDEAIMNGDSDAATHFDFDYRAASAPYRTYQGGVRGLRQFALDATGTGSGSVSSGGGAVELKFSAVAVAITRLGKFGASRLAQGEVALVLNTRAWLSLLTEYAATGVASPILTPDKYGPQATLLTGEMGRLFGIPVFISHGLEQRKNSLHTSGKNASGQANTQSMSVLFNRFNFRIGDRRDFRLETDRDIVSGRTDVVGSLRVAMNAIEGDPTDANWNPQGTPAVVGIVDHL